MDGEISTIGEIQPTCDCKLVQFPGGNLSEVGRRHQVPGTALKRFLLILSDRIFDSSVDRGMPNFTAAPAGPDTRPQVSFSAASIMFFSCTMSVRGSSTCCFDSDIGACGFASQVSSIEKISVSQRITERSMTFCSSRMF